MKHWCLVTSKENWKVCKDNNVFGFDYRYFITLKNFVKKGDKAVVYSHGGDFVAEVDIDSDFFYDDKNIGWTKNEKSFLFPYRIKLKIIKEGTLHLSFSTIEENQKANHNKPNHIDNLIFVADKGKTWNIYFQVSILPIPKEDFEYISNNL